MHEQPPMSILSYDLNGPALLFTVYTYTVALKPAEAFVNQ